MSEQNKPTLPEKLLSALKLHIPLHVIVDHLRAINLKPVKTWDDLSIQHADMAEMFEEFLSETICFGKKRAYVYDVNKDLLPVFDSLFKSESRWSVLDALASSSEQHTFFRSWIDPDFSVISFCTKREAFETYLLTKNDLSDGARNEYWREHSVVRIQSPVVISAFDSIVFDRKNEIIMVLIDDIRCSMKEDPDVLLSRLFAYIDVDGTLRAALNPVDLYPCIKEMYSNKSEGIVCQLSFECGTGALRDEKLKQGQLDLRDEKYHVKGKEAVGELFPFKLEIAYHPQKFSGLKSELVIGIKGKKVNNATKSGVFRFEINSQAGLGELKFCAYRMSLYLNNEQTI